MAFCQNCGAEVQGSFCNNCGTQIGSVWNAQPQSIVYNNVDVKPRYSVGHLILAGYPGISFLFGALFAFIASIGFFSMVGESGALIAGLAMLAVALVLFLITALFFLPGIKSIRKNTPPELIKKTTRSFIVKSLLFVLAWGVSIAACLYLIGLFLRAWRIGLSVSKPKDNEYTAFFNGQMIPVTRVADLEYSNVDKIRYMYVDENGTYYRPPLVG